MKTAREVAHAAVGPACDCGDGVHSIVCAGVRRAIESERDAQAAELAAVRAEAADWHRLAEAHDGRILAFRADLAQRDAALNERAERLVVAERELARVERERDRLRDTLENVRVLAELRQDQRLYVLATPAAPPPEAVPTYPNDPLGKAIARGDFGNPGEPPEAGGGEHGPIFAEPQGDAAVARLLMQQPMVSSVDHLLPVEPAPTATCGTCEGNGMSRVDKWGPCEDCNGTGKAP